MRDIEAVEADLGDPDVWEKPLRTVKSERRRRGIVVSVRLSPDEFARVQEVADGAGVAVSTLLRDRALAMVPSMSYGVEISAPIGTSYNFVWSPGATPAKV